MMINANFRNYIAKLYGFSLLELLITLAILAVLATMTTPLIEMTIKRTKEQELRTSLRTLREGIDAYKQAFDEGKITKNLDDSGYPKSLELLVEGVIDAQSPQRNKIFFLRKIPQDPMIGKNEWGLRSYKSTADNPQAGDDVFDVYSLSMEKGINGIPYNEW